MSGTVILKAYAGDEIRRTIVPENAKWSEVEAVLRKSFGVETAAPITVQYEDAKCGKLALNAATMQDAIRIAKAAGTDAPMLKVFFAKGPDGNPADTFPQQYARTQRMTLGEPRTITVSSDGSRVVFLRSRGGSDPVNCLWVLDTVTGTERLVADPKAMLVDGGDESDLPPEEKARRERLREGAGGITSYSTNSAVDMFCCPLAGRLFVGSLTNGAPVSEWKVPGPVFDPRLDPAGTRVAYVSGRALRIACPDGSSYELAGESSATVTWGSAEFIAAEEMSRMRGYWWSPDGSSLAVCRVDNAPVNKWFIADPAHPERPAAEQRYPAAGTNNAEVTLHVLAVDGSLRATISWDRVAYEYLCTVGWAGEEVLFSVSSRDQKTVVVYKASRLGGKAREVSRDTSSTWVDLVPGTPAQMSDGRLVTASDRDGWKRLMIDGKPVTPVSVNVRSIVAVESNSIVFAANTPEHPEGMGVWRWCKHDNSITALTPETGTNSVSLGSGTTVLRQSSTTLERPTFTVTRSTNATPLTITSLAETPLVKLNVKLSRQGARRIPTALFLPTGHKAGTKLPVLMDPYGGPHSKRVVDTYGGHCNSQWFADQGFAVVVIDGRGTPALGTEWERAIHLDLASCVLDDQVDALRALAAENSDIDLTRVGIRGWSFGGYLSALAVMRRPDVFHAGIAGAPVTEWRLYDTHYTERYLGHPSVDPAPYDRTSLLPDAAKLTRPLMLVHGLADDNVVAAHTLQLSSALLAAGRPHEVLPLSGVTHMVPQPVVAENLLLHQVDFLKRNVTNRARN